MGQDSITTVIDFTQHIADHTRDFTGREWVFKDINTWLVQAAGPRFFVLTGEPGSGKTAIASRLYQFSQATVAPPDNLTSLRPNFLSAAHFCWARDLRWIDPFVFTGSLATQLVNRDPAYRHILEQKLEEKREGRPSRIEVKQIARTVAGGQVIGVVVNVGGRSPIDAFNRAVREPLEALFQSQPSHEQVVILVDALDEALLKKEGEFDIASLLTHTDYLSSGVRFIVTTRPEAEVLQPLQGLQLEPVQLSLTSETELGRSLDDVKAYVLTVLNKTPQLADKLVADLPPEAFATAVQGKSEGNFLYVDYLLQMLSTRPGKISQEALDEVPKGLDKIYIAFLKRLVGKRSWSSYARVLGALAVAQEAVTEEQLARFVAVKEERVRSVLLSMRQFLEVDDALPASQRRYAIYHRSFADFLLDSDRAEQYWCNEVDQHLRIAAYYVKNYLKTNRAGGWRMCDAYGLQYTATHLAKAARGSEQPQQHELTAQLVRLVLDPDFQQARLADLVGLQRDLELALRTVAADKHPLVLPLIVEIALALVAFRREKLTPGQIFERALTGDVKGAEQHLALFSTEREWQQAVLLIIAWLAAQHNPDEAQALCARVTKELPTYGYLPLLLERVNAIFSHQPWQDLQQLDLLSVPTLETVNSIVAQMGGLKDMLGLPRAYPYEYEAVDGLPGVTSYQASIYMTADNSRLLVAYAATHPNESHEYLTHYLEILASNSYEWYRNRFLWPFLDAILRHPDQDWMREMVTSVAAAALAGSNLEFQEGLPLTLLALQAHAGEPDAQQALNDSRDQVRTAANELVYTSKRDSWGSYTRKLSALAQAFFLLGRPDDSVELLDLAQNLNYGFAGFQAPAWLTLAEAIRICRGNEQAITNTLDAAQRSAHNIEEPTFCARTTARFNAMKAFWWKSPLVSFNVSVTAQDLRLNPYDPRFAALHQIGEGYERRDPERKGSPLLERMRQANTLQALAQVYDRPVVEFQRLNPSWSIDQPLDQETRVYVPDSEFAPLLAARFAAEALVTETLSAEKQMQLIQSLVPIAAANPTALDTVLARLLLAAKPDDPKVLKDLAQTIALYVKA